MRLVLRGHALVDADAEPAEPAKPARMPRPVKARLEYRCGQTKESLRPDTFQTFINQCTKETPHSPPHVYETHVEKKQLKLKEI